MRKVLIIFIFSLFAITLGCRQSQDSIVFKFKYVPGETYTYKIIDEVTSKHILGEGNNKNYRIFQVQKSTIKVLDKDSTGVYKLEVDFLIESDSLWQVEGDQKIGRKREHDKHGNKYSYTLHMREDGEIIDIKGRDKSSTFFFERAYKTSQPVFPAQEISPGYSWKQTVAVNMPNVNPFTAVTTYTFSGFESIGDYECAVIEFLSRLEIKADLTETKWNRKQYQKWDYENITTSSGKIYFAYNKGAMVKKETLFTVKRVSDYVDKSGKAVKDFRRIVDKERIKLVCVHQDSSFSSTN